MCAENLDWLVAVALDELLARLGRHRGIGVGLADPFRMGDLDAVMNPGGGCPRAVRGSPACWRVRPAPRDQPRLPGAPSLRSASESRDCRRTSTSGPIRASTSCTSPWERAAPSAR